MDDDVYRQWRAKLFARLWRELAPFEERIENTERIPHDEVYPLLANMGALALLVPSEYGGLGLTVSQYVPVIAEVSKIHGGIRALVHQHNSMAMAVDDLGSPAQKSEILPAAATGERSVTFALTEPDHGTGADTGTLARRDRDAYVIDGRKWLITNSHFATDFIVFAKTDPDAGGAGMSAILVPRDTPGLTIEPLPETMGCKGGEHGMLTFTGSRVPADGLLGDEGDGTRLMDEALGISRVFVAAASLGTAERAFELSVTRANTRVTFGKPIGDRQAIQRYLAEMAVDIHALRLMVTDAAQRWDRGDSLSPYSSLCKQFGIDAVSRVTDRALLVHGGMGYTRTSSVERLYRDARLNWFEEGPPTVHHMIVARAFLDGFRWKEL